MGANTSKKPTPPKTPTPEPETEPQIQEPDEPLSALERGPPVTKSAKSKEKLEVKEQYLAIVKAHPDVQTQARQLIETRVWDYMTYGDQNTFKLKVIGATRIQRKEKAELLKLLNVREPTDEDYNDMIVEILEGNKDVLKKIELLSPMVEHMTREEVGWLRDVIIEDPTILLTDAQAALEKLNYILSPDEVVRLGLVRDRHQIMANPRLRPTGRAQRLLDTGAWTLCSRQEKEELSVGVLEDDDLAVFPKQKLLTEMGYPDLILRSILSMEDTKDCVDALLQTGFQQVMTRDQEDLLRDRIETSGAYTEEEEFLVLHKLFDDPIPPHLLQLEGQQQQQQQEAEDEVSQATFVIEDLPPPLIEEPSPDNSSATPPEQLPMAPEPPAKKPKKKAKGKAKAKPKPKPKASPSPVPSSTPDEDPPEAQIPANDSMELSQEQPNKAELLKLMEVSTKVSKVTASATLRRKSTMFYAPIVTRKSSMRGSSVFIHMEQQIELLVKVIKASGVRPCFYQPIAITFGELCNDELMKVLVDDISAVCSEAKTRQLINFNSANLLIDVDDTAKITIVDELDEHIEAIRNTIKRKGTHTSCHLPYSMSFEALCNDDTIRNSVGRASEVAAACLEGKRRSGLWFVTDELKLEGTHKNIDILLLQDDDSAMQILRREVLRIGNLNRETGTVNALYKHIVNDVNLSGFGNVHIKKLLERAKTRGVITYNESELKDEVLVTVVPDRAQELMRSVVREQKDELGLVTKRLTELEHDNEELKANIAESRAEADSLQQQIIVLQTELLEAQSKGALPSTPQTLVTVASNRTLGNKERKEAHSTSGTQDNQEERKTNDDTSSDSSFVPPPAALLQRKFSIMVSKVIAKEQALPSSPGTAPEFKPLVTHTTATQTYDNGKPPQQDQPTQTDSTANVSDSAMCTDSLMLQDAATEIDDDLEHASLSDTPLSSPRSFSRPRLQSARWLATFDTLQQHTGRLHLRRPSSVMSQSDMPPLNEPTSRPTSRRQSVSSRRSVGSRTSSFRDPPTVRIKTLAPTTQASSSNTTAFTSSSSSSTSQIQSILQPQQQVPVYTAMHGNDQTVQRNTTSNFNNAPHRNELYSQYPPDVPPSNAFMHPVHSQHAHMGDNDVPVFGTTYAHSPPNEQPLQGGTPYMPTAPTTAHNPSRTPTNAYPRYNYRYPSPPPSFSAMREMSPPPVSPTFGLNPHTQHRQHRSHPHHTHGAPQPPGGEYHLQEGMGGTGGGQVHINNAHQHHRHHHTHQPPTTQSRKSSSRVSLGGENVLGYNPDRNSTQILPNQMHPNNRHRPLSAPRTRPSSGSSSSSRTAGGMTNNINSMSMSGTKEFTPPAPPRPISREDYLPNDDRKYPSSTKQRPAPPNYSNDTLDQYDENQDPQSPTSPLSSDFESSGNGNSGTKKSKKRHHQDESGSSITPAELRESLHKRNAELSNVRAYDTRQMLWMVVLLYSHRTHLKLSKPEKKFLSNIYNELVYGMKHPQIGASVEMLADVVHMWMKRREQLFDYMKTNGEPTDPLKDSLPHTYQPPPKHIINNMFVGSYPLTLRPSSGATSMAPSPVATTPRSLGIHSQSPFSASFPRIGSLAHNVSSSGLNPHAHSGQQPTWHGHSM